MVVHPFGGGDISELMFSRASMTLLKIFEPPVFKKKDEKGVFEENSLRSFHRHYNNNNNYYYNTMMKNLRWETSRRPSARGVEECLLTFRALLSALWAPTLYQNLSIYSDLRRLAGWPAGRTGYCTETSLRTAKETVNLRNEGEEKTAHTPHGTNTTPHQMKILKDRNEPM